MGYGLSNYSPVGFMGGGSFVDQHPTLPRISPNGISFPRERERADQQDKSFVTLENGSVGDYRAYIVKFTRGREFSFGFNFTNSGRWGVTVMDIPLKDHGNPYFAVAGTFMGRSELDRDTPPPVVPLRPFVLAPGHQRWIEVRFRFRDCNNVDLKNAGYTWFTTFPVTFRFLGLTRHEAFALPEILAIKAGGEGC